MNHFLVKTSGKVDEGESLLVLHGWGMNSQVWQPIREQLESRYRVTWVDLPGHGFNRHIKAQSMDEIVDLIIDAIPDVIPNKTHIVGWSLGGLIAQAITQRIPDRINSMTLVTTTPKFSQSLIEGEYYWLHAMSDDVLNNFALNLKEDPEGTFKRFVALQFMGIKDSKLIQRDLIQKLFHTPKPLKNEGGVIAQDERQKTPQPSFLGSQKKYITPLPGEVSMLIEAKINNHKRATFCVNGMPDIEALDLGLKILQQADFRDTKVNIPQHWIFADGDRLIPVKVINDLLSLRPDAQITLLENTGHVPFMTHPDEFLNAVTNFIDKIENRYVMSDKK